MKKETRNFAVATAMLIGTTIGVGIFGVPYAISQVGLWGALAYFIVLGGIQLLQQLFFAEAAIATPEKLRLVGLVEKWLGRRYKHLATVTAVLGFWASMLAYMIVGGSFLHVLFGPLVGGSEFAYQVGWGLLGACLTWFGLKVVSRIDFFVTCGMIILMFVILAACLGHFDAANLIGFTGHDLFLPYGVILFSLGGLPAITEMEDIFEGKHRSYRTSVVTGTMVAGVLTAVFGFAVWGATGAGVSRDAVSGLAVVLGSRIHLIAAAFGFMAVYASFFGSAVTLQETFEYDYKASHFTAWMMTGSVPLALVLAGNKDFVSIVSFSGAVFGGITAVLVACLYVAVTRKGAVKKHPLGAPLWLAYVSIAALSLGAAYEVGKSLLEFAAQG
ncbi:MAG: hypothetical protein RLZZ324_873 [Candidatus Parcubacteria bacterium]|jgi:tyrosine-specific transport protein